MLGEPMKERLREAARNALNVQSACNFSGVAFSLARDMQVLCDVAHLLGRGTEWRNHHPVARMYAEQLLYLSGGGVGNNGDWCRAHKWCSQVVDEGRDASDYEAVDVIVEGSAA